VAETNAVDSTAETAAADFTEPLKPHAGLEEEGGEEEGEEGEGEEGEGEEPWLVVGIPTVPR
jgi:hypothetical protein